MRLSKQREQTIRDRCRSLPLDCPAAVIADMKCLLAEIDALRADCKTLASVAIGYWTEAGKELAARVLAEGK